MPAQQNILVIDAGNVRVKGLKISGAKGEAGKVCGQEIIMGGVGIYVKEGWPEPVIANCYVHSNASHGIYFEGNNIDGKVTNCVVSNNCNDGIRINNSARVTVNNSKIGTFESGLAKYGNYWDGVVMINRSDTFNIENNIISGNGNDIALLGDTSGIGIRIKHSSYGTIKGNYIGRYNRTE
jgi:hypothetical protein